MQMAQHNKGVGQKKTKDSTDSNVEPELHYISGIPQSFGNSYEAQNPSKVNSQKNGWNIVKPPELKYPMHLSSDPENGNIPPESTGQEIATYKLLSDSHFKHLKINTLETENKSIPAH